MPTTTFWNLPEAKRQSLIDIAIEEFSAHPYASASLSRIVERAGIAKGSIYQYFENKHDFFLYLLDYAVARQLALLSDLTPPQEQTDFFALLRWQMSVSVRVGLLAPELVRLLRRAVEAAPPLRSEVERIIGRAGAGHFEQMVRQAQARGELADDLDPELAAYVLQRITGDLGELLMRRLGLNTDAVVDDIALFNTPEVEALFDAIIVIVQHGLARRTTPAGTTGVHP